MLAPRGRTILGFFRYQIRSVRQRLPEFDIKVPPQYSDRGQSRHELVSDPSPGKVSLHNMVFETFLASYLASKGNIPLPFMSEITAELDTKIRIVVSGSDWIVF